MTQDETDRSVKKRDPEGRKRQISKAAAQLLMQEGSARFTHRRVAELAGVPLGSTTQHFATLDDLKRAGLERMAVLIEEGFDEALEAVHAEGGDVPTIAHSLHRYLADTDQVRADTSLYAVAINDPEVRPLAVRAFEKFVDGLGVYVGAERARMLAVFIDGASLYACLHGEALEEDALIRTIHALMGIDPQTTEG